MGVFQLAQFLRFLFIKGKTRADLSKSVPRPANWRQTKLPVYIGPEKVQRLLESCDQKTQVGARDYAVLMLLSRLGLRACEANNLTLDDIHWRDGALTVRGKGKESSPLRHNQQAALSTAQKRVLWLQRDPRKLPASDDL